MKIALLGATGFVGGPILAEALSRPGLSVTAIVRNPSALPVRDGLTAVQGDILDRDRHAELLAGHDAVIHAFHPGRGVDSANVYAQSVAGHEAIIAASKSAAVPRLLCVGGAASLMTPEGKEYIESSHWDPEFDPFRNSILGTRALYYLLKPETDIDWVFLAPSAWLRPGERTGVFRTAANDMLFGADGTSRISLEDYALAMINECVTPQHHHERFTVGY